MPGRKPKNLTEEDRIQIAQDIPKHVAEYLKRGGKITKIPIGKTGYNPFKGRNTIVLEGSNVQD